MKINCAYFLAAVHFVINLLPIPLIVLTPIWCWGIIDNSHTDNITTMGETDIGYVSCAFDRHDMDVLVWFALIITSLCCLVNLISVFVPAVLLSYLVLALPILAFIIIASISNAVGHIDISRRFDDGWSSYSDNPLYPDVSCSAGYSRVIYDGLFNETDCVYFDKLGDSGEYLTICCAEIDESCGDMNYYQDEFVRWFTIGVTPVMLLLGLSHLMWLRALVSSR